MATGIELSGVSVLEDVAAIRRYARSGDTEAFEVLVRRYGAMVLATCRRTLASDADAEDAAQETFFKLATSASKIQSNVPAWLHRCAIGTSIDLARRAGVRRQAERESMRTNADATSDTVRWQDLEPLIDHALSQLSDDDRGIIVARYLAGHSQAEIAASLRVSEGTVSRRLMKAVKRLRESLSSSGALVVTAAGSASFLAALESGSTGLSVPASLAGALGKIGLAGVGASTSASGIKAANLLVTALTLGTIGTIGYVTTQRPASTLSSSASSTLNAAAAAPGPALPSGKIGPFQIVTATDSSFEERGIWFTERQFEVRHGYTPDGESKRATLDIQSVRVVEDDPKTADLEERGVITARVRRILPADDEWSRFTLGRVVRISVGYDEFGRVVLNDVDGKVQIGRNEPRWFGVRPPADWPEAARVPSGTGELGLLGPWTESERVPVTITAEEIRFGTDRWAKERYRVISWEQVEGHSRIMSVNGGGRDPRLIGTRFQLLLREDPNGYTIAYYPPGSKNAGSWPTSFAYSPTNPVRVVSFERDGGGS